jgi:hypothetical protein
MNVLRKLVGVSYENKDLQEVELVADAVVYGLSPDGTLLLCGYPVTGGGSVKRKLWLFHLDAPISVESQDAVQVGVTQGGAVLFLEGEQQAITRSRHRGWSR